MKETSYIYPNFPKELIKSQLHLDRYTKFIDSRKQDRKKSDDLYTENHHKIPKSLGGAKDSKNMIRLTAREHFIAHLILWKAFGGKMTSAFVFMTNNRREHSGKLSSHQYKVIKEDYSLVCQQRMIGYTPSEETLQIMRQHYIEFPEARVQMAERTFQRWQDDNFRQKTIENMLKSWDNLERHQQCKEEVKTRFHQPNNPSRKAFLKSGEVYNYVIYDEGYIVYNGLNIKDFCTKNNFLYRTMLDRATNPWRKVQKHKNISIVRSLLPWRVSQSQETRLKRFKSKVIYTISSDTSNIIIKGDNLRLLCDENNIAYQVMKDRLKDPLKKRLKFQEWSIIKQLKS